MKSVLQLEERLRFLLSAAACQYLLPVRNKIQFPEKYSEIPHSTLVSVKFKLLIFYDFLKKGTTPGRHMASLTVNGLA